MSGLKTKVVTVVLLIASVLGVFGVRYSWDIMEERGSTQLQKDAMTQTVFQWETTE